MNSVREAMSWLGIKPESVRAPEDRLYCELVRMAKRLKGPVRGSTACPEFSANLRNKCLRMLVDDGRIVRVSFGKYLPLKGKL